jgi:hypothetical protein
LRRDFRSESLITAEVRLLERFWFISEKAWSKESISLTIIVISLFILEMLLELEVAPLLLASVEASSPLFYFCSESLIFASSSNVKSLSNSSKASPM